MSNINGLIPDRTDVERRIYADMLMNRASESSDEFETERINRMYSMVRHSRKFKARLVEEANHRWDDWDFSLELKEAEQESFKELGHRRSDATAVHGDEPTEEDPFAMLKRQASVGSSFIKLKNAREAIVPSSSSRPPSTASDVPTVMDVDSAAGLMPFDPKGCFRRHSTAAIRQRPQMMGQSAAPDDDFVPSPRRRVSFQDDSIAAFVASSKQHEREDKRGSDEQGSSGEEESGIEEESGEDENDETGSDSSDEEEKAGGGTGFVNGMEVESADEDGGVGGVSRKAVNEDEILEDFDDQREDAHHKDVDAPIEVLHFMVAGANSSATLGAPVPEREKKPNLGKFIKKAWGKIVTSSRKAKSRPEFL